MLKTVVLLNIFVQSVIFVQGSFISNEHHLYEIEIFWNIINVFTVTFGHFNASLLKKHINFFNKNCSPKIVDSSVHTQITR